MQLSEMLGASSFKAFFSRQQLKKKLFSFFCHLGFLLQTFTIHRAVGKEGGYLLSPRYNLGT